MADATPKGNAVSSGANMRLQFNQNSAQPRLSPAITKIRREHNDDADDFSRKYPFHGRCGRCLGTNHAWIYCTAVCVDCDSLDHVGLPCPSNTRKYRGWGGTRQSTPRRAPPIVEPYMPIYQYPAYHQLSFQPPSQMSYQPVTLPIYHSAHQPENHAQSHYVPHPAHHNALQPVAHPPRQGLFSHDAKVQQQSSDHLTPAQSAPIATTSLEATHSAPSAPITNRQTSMPMPVKTQDQAERDDLYDTSSDSDESIETKNMRVELRNLQRKYEQKYFPAQARSARATTATKANPDAARVVGEQNQRRDGSLQQLHRANDDLKSTIARNTENTVTMLDADRKALAEEKERLMSDLQDTVHTLRELVTVAKMTIDAMPRPASQQTPPLPAPLTSLQPQVASTRAVVDYLDLTLCCATCYGFTSAACAPSEHTYVHAIGEDKGDGKSGD